MSVFDFDDWKCAWNPRKGTHTFTAPGRAPIILRSNAAWKPGMPPVAPRGRYLPRFASVERTLLRRWLAYGMKGWFEDHPRDRSLDGHGNVLDGAEVGGKGIDLEPRFGPDTMAELDGVIERHPVCAFHFDTGEPLTRADIGYRDTYQPYQTTAWDGVSMQLAPFVTPLQHLEIGHPCSRWQRFDPAHLIRAYTAAVAAWRERRDPIARAWLLIVANDVMLALPEDGAVDTSDWSLFSMMNNVMRTPHIAKLMPIRDMAWCLRAVVEAQRVAWSQEREEWIVCFVHMVHMGQGLNGTFNDNWYGESQEQEQPWTVRQPGFHLLAPNEGEAPSWQGPFLLRALYDARCVAPVHEMVKEIVARYMRIYQTCERVPGEHFPHHPGLPKWIRTSVNRELLPAITDGIGAANTAYDNDAFVVKALMGL